MKGHAEGAVDLPVPFVPIDRVYFRATWPAGVDMKWHETKGLDAPKVTRTADGGELVVDMRNLSLKNSPQFFPIGARLQVSDYARWEDVSREFAPLYAKAETLGPDSPLKAEVAKIAAASSDPETRAAAALTLVQEDVRYVFKGMNLGGFVPTDADLTWRRRYGDCKAKSVLLVALLRELNISAEVAMVSVARGHDVADSLPGALIFDHVFVRATIGGQVYWLDPTRLHDSDLELIAMPRYVSALPINDQGADLELLSAPKPDKPLREYHIAYDASAGPKALTPVHIEYIFRGEAARNEYRRFVKLDDADRQRSLKASIPVAIRRTFDVSKVAFVYDHATHEAHETLDGSTFLPWVADPATGALAFAVDRSAVVSNSSPTVTPAPVPLPPVIHPQPHSLKELAQIAPELGQPIPPPIVVPMPTPPVVVPMIAPPSPYTLSLSDWQYDRTIVTIILPRGGAGFTVDGADINKSVIGHDYVRTAAIKDGVFTMDLSSRTTQRDLSPSQETQARHDMIGFGDDVKLKAPVGFKPSLVETEIRVKRSADTPEQFRDRADARLETGDYDGAMKDLDAALKLKADDASTINLRCFLRAEANRDLPAALTDCDRAVGLAPTNADFLDSRGLAHFRLGQFDLALRDYEAALSHNTRLTSSRFMHGVVLRRMGREKEGDAEIATAEQSDPDVAADYARYGIAP